MMGMWDYLTPFQIVYEASKYSSLETGFPSKYYALLLHPIWGKNP
jgi:hypothetical protein